MDLKSQLKRFIYTKAPNSLIQEHFEYNFPDVPAGEIQRTLEELVKEEFIVSEEQKNLRVESLSRTAYKYSKPIDFKINKYIEIDGVKLPRLLDLDRARAEDVNALVLQLDKLISKKISNIDSILHEKKRSHVGSWVGIAGIIITIIALINVSTRTIFVSETMSFFSLMKICFANILPLGIVLLVFTLLLRWVLD